VRSARKTGGDQIQTSFRAVIVPPASPVLTTPRGLDDQRVTLRIRCVMCSTPRGTTNSSPAALTTSRSRKPMRISPRDDEKRLVGVVVRVPHELTFELDQLELVVVQLRHDARRPSAPDERELRPQVDRVGPRRAQRGVSCWARGLSSRSAIVRPATVVQRIVNCSSRTVTNAKSSRPSPSTSPAEQDVDTLAGGVEHRPDRDPVGRRELGVAIAARAQIEIVGTR
jgi:hypothetical protein